MRSYLVHLVKRFVVQGGGYELSQSLTVLWPAVRGDFVSYEAYQ